MNQATYLKPGHNLDVASLALPWRGPLGAWLAAVTRRFLSETTTAASKASISTLSKGRTLWVDRPLARDVSCVEGVLWLTFDGVQKDFILEAGESYRCEYSSPLGIHALDPATVRIV